MIQDITAALKVMLKQRGWTYADVASQLGLSESSINRCFSGCDFSLKRLQRICDLIGVDLMTLIHQAEENQRNIDELSEQQEKALAKKRQAITERLFTAKSPFIPADPRALRDRSTRRYSIVSQARPPGNHRFVTRK